MISLLVINPPGEMRAVGPGSSSIGLGVRRTRSSASGIGGFFDSIIVIVVVTVGVVLVFGAVSIATCELSESSTKRSLGEEADRMLEQFLSERRMFVRDGVLSAYSLEEPCSVSIDEDRVLGCRFLLIELFENSAPVVIAENGTLPSHLDEVQVRSVPINVQYALGDVRAAILSIWVW